MSEPTVNDDSGWADLHMHSNYSDGMLSPTAIVEFASKQDLRAIAITDHDSVSGIDEALEAAKGTGLEIITGIELSTVLDGRDIHILGYGFDHKHPELLTQLDLYRKERQNRAERIVIKLQKLGVPIQIEEVTAKAGHGSIGRPHIADLIIAKGYAKGINDVFNRYLGQDGAAYESKYKITPKFAIDLLTRAGGVSALAHPTLNMKESHVYEVIRQGVHGIEVIHSKHSPETTSFYSRLADHHGLLKTGGSDCHGRSSPYLIGLYRIPYANLERLRHRTTELV